LISNKDVVGAVLPAAGSIVAGVVAVVLTSAGTAAIASPLVRLVAANGVLFGVYVVVLLWGFRQWEVYTGALRETGLWPTGPARAESPCR
jgi:hypothetical protein